MSFTFCIGDLEVLPPVGKAGNLGDADGVLVTDFADTLVGDLVGLKDWQLKELVHGRYSFLVTRDMFWFRLRSAGFESRDCCCGSGGLWDRLIWIPGIK